MKFQTNIKRPMIYCKIPSKQPTTAITNIPTICYLDTITQRGRRTERFYPHSTPSQSSVSTDSLLPTLDPSDPPYFDNNATLQMKRRLAAILCTSD